MLKEEQAVEPVAQVLQYIKTQDPLDLLLEVAAEAQNPMELHKF